MEKITILFLCICTLGLAQNTYIPDDNFEQALIDQGYDSGSLDDYVPTTNISSLTNLSISNKGISDLTGIEDFTALDNLLCWNNNLTEIDLSQNLALNSLKCNGNQLTSLDLSNNSALTNLKCYNNLLTVLDLRNNMSLDYLRCENNQLTVLDVKNGNNENVTFLDATANPNLNCINVDNVNYSTTNWVDIDAQTNFNENCSALSVNEFDIENSISLYPNPTKDLLNVSTNVHVKSIELFNIKGETVINVSNKKSINLKPLKSGIYLVKIETENRNIIKKILLQ